MSQWASGASTSVLLRVTTTWSPCAASPRKAVQSAWALPSGTLARRIPANCPAKCAIRLSTQLPSWAAMMCANASTRPGRSSPSTVSTSDVGICAPFPCLLVSRVHRQYALWGMGCQAGRADRYDHRCRIQLSSFVYAHSWLTKKVGVIVVHGYRENVRKSGRWRSVQRGNGPPAGKKEGVATGWGLLGTGCQGGDSKCLLFFLSVPNILAERA